MKTAIYIEDGTVQVVLTPETEFEQHAIIQVEEKKVEVQIFVGGFYDCRGGWVRQIADRPGAVDERSLILRVVKREPEHDTPAT